MNQLAIIATRRSVRNLGLIFAGLTASVVLSTACQANSQRGGLGEDQQILASCNSSTRLASLVAMDGTGSSASDTLTDERMKAVESIVRTTAICGGALKVIVFSASSSATTTLFDEPLRLEGATDNGRLKRVSSLVSDAMRQIRAAYGPAVAALSQTASDIIGMYRLAGEWVSQLGRTYRLSLTMLTDGVHNAGLNLGARVFTKHEAAELANQIDMPKLPGASVVVAGLGRVAGAPPSSAMTEGLVAFYDALCRRTGSARCLSVTDYAIGR